jgi:proton-translocating NADH-quinone oxidoreductase chain M
MSILLPSYLLSTTSDNSLTDFYSPNITPFYINYNYFDLPYLNISYSLGLDELTFTLVNLTSFTIFMSVCASYFSIHTYPKYFYSIIFFIQFLLFGVFLTTNLLVFYVYFESLLIPMFLLIGIWGSRERRVHAAYQFFYYTLIPSLFMLIAIIYILLFKGSLDYTLLYSFSFTFTEKLFIWLSFFLAFASKLPLFPFHIWLPEAHTEAPTSGSMILAGILLKVGAYGMFRFLLTCFQEATEYFKPIVIILCLLGVLLPSLTALRETDLKRIVAYSSVVHMNFMTLGMLNVNSVESLVGAASIMINHGIISIGLFGCVGLLYDRYGTRNIQEFGNLATRMPFFFIVFFIIILANIGLPLTNSFPGELMIFLGLTNIPKTLVFTVFFLILNTCYNIIMFSRVFFGFRRSSSIVISYIDLLYYELYILIPVILIILFGIYPHYLIEYFEDANFLKLTQFNL